MEYEERYVYIYIYMCIFLVCDPPNEVLFVGLYGIWVNICVNMCDIVCILCG